MDKTEAVIYVPTTVMKGQYGHNEIISGLRTGLGLDLALV